MVLTNIVPVVFAFLLDAGVIVIYIFAPGLWEGDKHKSWQDRLDFTHQMLVMACLAALRMLFFIPYVCKLYSPYHRIRWCIPLTWLLLHQIAVCVRAGFLSRNDFDLGYTSFPWIMLYLSTAAIICQLIVVRMMTNIPVPLELEYY